MDFAGERRMNSGSLLALYYYNYAMKLMTTILYCPVYYSASACQIARLNFAAISLSGRRRTKRYIDVFEGFTEILT